jgi:hypothetical protein
MARCKLGHILSDIAGKIQGLTFQQSGSGLIARRTPSRRGKQSNYTREIQNINYIISTQWFNLSASLRLQWQQFADFVKQGQKHNKNYILSGQNMFYRINFYRYLYGHALLYTPVFDNTRAVAVTVNLAYAGAQLYAHTDRTLDNTTEFIVLKASLPLHTNNENFENKVSLIIFSTQNSVNNIFTPEYVDRYGVHVVAGDKIGYHFSIVSLINGLGTAVIKKIDTI